MQQPSHQTNVVMPEDKEKLRILTLGESTSADAMATKKDGAWPRQLERELIQSGIPARVYNEGIPSTNSALILTHLQNHLDKYKPQIVITMMGINDSHGLRFQTSSFSDFMFFINRIRLVKLARWLHARLEAAANQPIYYEYLKPNHRSHLEQGIAMAQSMPAREVERILRDRAGHLTDTEIALILAGIAKHFFGDFDSLYDGAKSFDFSDRAFQLAPFHHFVAFWAVLATVRNRDWESGILKSRKLLQCGPNLPDDILGWIGKIALHDPDLAKAEVFRSRGLRVDKADSQNITAAHYRHLFTQVRNQGIQLIAMQYPTLPLADLIDNFVEAGSVHDREEREIIFVSNERNFQEALISNKYEALFKDRFRGSWGHTTDLGHTMIAQAALEAVKVVYFRSMAKGSTLAKTQ